MTVRPLRRALLVALSTGLGLGALTGTVTPSASAERPVVYGPFTEAGTFIGPVSGQSALHNPHAGEQLGRKFK